MFGDGQLTDCEQRKAALLRQSAAHRIALATEAQKLRPIASWVDLGIDVAGKARVGWQAVAPLLSWWQVRRNKPSGLIQKAASAISLVRTVTAVWTGRREIGGVTLGRKIAIEGVPVMHGDHLEFTNPHYTLLPR